MSPHDDMNPVSPTAYAAPSRSGTGFDLEYAEHERSLSAFNDLHFRITSDGTYVRVWALDPSLLLVPPDQIAGTKIADYFPPALTKRFLEAIRHTIDTSEVSTVEYSQGEGDETRYSEARIAALGGDEVMAVVRDVSSLKALEQQLVHAESMRLVGRLAGGIAHDFNNVLHVIRGHAQALRRHLDDPIETDRRLDAITHAVDRTSSLVERLMMLSRPTANNPTPTNVDSFVRDLGPALTQLLGETIELEFALDADDCAVAIDDSRFENVLLNLASNALDAMPQGGALRVTTGRDGRERICITFTDTGDGIHPEVLPLVFEPFFTTKAPGIGTGIGLSTTYDSISVAGGSITVDSAPDRGTTFTIVLPTTTDRPTEVEASGHQVKHLRGVTILVVEDEPEVLALCVDALTEFGHHVVGASDASEALAVIDSGQAVDLLLTDVVMPSMSGPELARKIMTRLGSVPAVFMTGYADGTDIAGHGIEPNDILRKPFTEDDLARAVNSQLGDAP
jgi:two-component system cell cycle sensor histidine kinase/response regulator CckA